jgi:hypothetical protein
MNDFNAAKFGRMPPRAPADVDTGVDAEA